MYPRWESNPNLRFRKPPFYPLNYKGAPASTQCEKRFGHEDSFSFANIEILKAVSQKKESILKQHT